MCCVCVPGCSTMLCMYAYIFACVLVYSLLKILPQRHGVRPHFPKVISTLWSKPLEASAISPESLHMAVLWGREFPPAVNPSPGPFILPWASSINLCTCPRDGFSHCEGRAPWDKHQSVPWCCLISDWKNYLLTLPGTHPSWMPTFQVAETPSPQELPPSAWPVSMPMGNFLDQ